MTTARLTAAPGGRYGVALEGHAARSPALCSALSALVQALQGWLHASGAEIYREELSPGHCALCFSGEGSAAAFALVRVGLLRLQATDPKRLQCFDIPAPGV